MHLANVAGFADAEAAATSAEAAQAHELKSAAVEAASAVQPEAVGQRVFLGSGIIAWAFGLHHASDPSSSYRTSSAYCLALSFLLGLFLLAISTVFTMRSFLWHFLEQLLPLLLRRQLDKTMAAVTRWYVNHR